MLAIFGFRKNRSQTLSNQGPESEAEVYGDGSHTVATAPTGTALENVYTLLQPPRSAARAGSPNDGADGKVSDHQGKGTLVLSPPPVPGIPHPAVGGGKHPFFSPREIPEVDTVFELPVETDKYWADDKQRTTDVLLHVENDWMVEGRLRDPHAERQWFEDRQQERTFGEPRMGERQTDRYWTESRHPDRQMERQWTVDKHTQRQIDRKIEKQWMGGRQIERSWSENRSMDMQVDSQGTESRHQGRKLDRQVQALHLAQRPLPPYPSDRTPSPKQGNDPLKSTEAAAIEWHSQDSQEDRHTSPDAVGGPVGWRSSGDVGGGVSACQVAPCASKPDPPPQSSKPNLSKLRQRHRRESSDTLPEEEGDEERDLGKTERRERRRDSESQPPPIPEKPKTSSYVMFPKESANEKDLPPPPVPPPVSKPIHGLPDRAASQGEEGLRPQAPVKPQRNRKAMSCDAGTERESPNNVGKPPNRNPPMKKPRLPQNRNKSLEMSDSFNSAPGPGELL